MQKFSQGKRWLMASGILLFAFACQSKSDADMSDQGGEKSREQERMDRRMRERKVIQDSADQNSDSGDSRQRMRRDCNPCRKMKKCTPPCSDENASMDQSMEEAESAPVVAEESAPLEAAPAVEQSAPAPVVEQSPQAQVPPADVTPVQVAVEITPLQSAAPMESSPVVVPEVKIEEKTILEPSETVQK